MALEIKSLDGVAKTVSNKFVVVLADNDNTFGIPYIKAEEVSEGMVEWVLLSKDKKQEIYKVSKQWNDTFTLCLSKELCGAYSYYLKASYINSKNKKKESTDGINISGYCEPRIQNVLSTKTVIKPGEDLKIDLKLEGLNANDLNLEIYSKEDSKLKKLNNLKGKCIEGELSFFIEGAKTIKWKPKKNASTLQLVIKLQDKNTKKYLSHG